MQKPTHMPDARRRVVPVVVALALAAALTPARAQDRPLHPGGAISAPHPCSIGFIFTDGMDLYASTAGHCTGGVGSSVANPGTGDFGTVVLRRNAGDDIAFIRVDAGMRHLVDAAVFGWGMPTGVASPLQTARGDRIGFAGRATGLGTLEPTRARGGLLVDQDERGFRAGAPALFGDSGGPVIHLGTGRAIGLVEGFAATVPPSTVVGTTVERGIELAAAAGLTLALVTS